MKETIINHKLVLEPEYETSASSHSSHPVTPDRRSGEEHQGHPRRQSQSQAPDRPGEKPPVMTKAEVKKQRQLERAARRSGDHVGGRQGAKTYVVPKRTEEEQLVVEKQLREAMDEGVGS